MAKMLKALTITFGAVCMAIALSHVVIGQRVIPGGRFVNPTMDSEDRFYATLFLGFGAAMIWCARDLPARRGVFDALWLTFFLGGVARLISAAMVGLPAPLFLFLGGLELVLPPLFWWMHRAAFGASLQPPAPGSSA